MEFQDLRVGLRLLWKDKAYTATAALTLALCIGANTALFSIVQHVLLRPLPFPGADRLVLMMNTYPGAGAPGYHGNSGVPDYYDRLRGMTTYVEQALYRGRSASLDERGVPTRVRGMAVTPSFFRLVGVPPRFGRVFDESEGEIGNEQKVILSHALWQSQFGGDPDVVGRDLRIDSQPYRVVGVMPKDFTFVEKDILLWTPLVFTAQMKSDDARHSNSWQNLARLKPGATVLQAQEQVDAINAANLERFPEFKQLLINAKFRTIVVPFQDDLVRDVKAALYLLWGGAVFVLLIGTANVVNLALVRARGRVKELATRLALGASRGRVARQLVTESLLLTTVAAAGGALIAYAMLRVFGSLGLEDLPRGSEIRLDGAAVAYALAIASAVGIALGLVPVGFVLPKNLTVVMREEGRSGTASVGARMLRRALVVTQVAFAFVLVVGAGLLLVSFRHVLAVDPGFRSEGVLTTSVTLPRTRYADDAAMRRFADESLRRIRALPGVTDAGATTTIPFGGNYSDSVILAEGYQMSPGESVISPSRVIVTPGYFEAMGVRLLKGRFFEERDNPDAPHVVIVDDRLAKRFWPGQDAIGRRMYQPSNPRDLLAVSDKTVWLTIVGVVAETKLRDPAEGDERVGAYYFPAAQTSAGGFTFAIRSEGNPRAQATAVRQAVNETDRELPVFDVMTMGERMEKALVVRRSPLLLAMGFGGVALFLSAVGIYGVLAYLVAQRTKEIGIRIALGSSARAVFRLILGEGLTLIALGLVLGGAGAAALRKSLASQLFGITPTDPAVLAAAALVLAVVAAAACGVPARRATKIDPVIALAE